MSSSQTSDCRTGGVGGGDLVSADGATRGHVGDPVGEDVLVPEDSLTLVGQLFHREAVPDLEVVVLQVEPGGDFSGAGQFPAPEVPVLDVFEEGWDGGVGAKPERQARTAPWWSTRKAWPGQVSLRLSMVFKGKEKSKI